MVLLIIAPSNMRRNNYYGKCSTRWCPQAGRIFCCLHMLGGIWVLIVIPGVYICNYYMEIALTPGGFDSLYLIHKFFFVLVHIGLGLGIAFSQMNFCSESIVKYERRKNKKKPNGAQVSPLAADAADADDESKQSSQDEEPVPCAVTLCTNVARWCKLDDSAVSVDELPLGDLPDLTADPGQHTHLPSLAPPSTLSPPHARAATHPPAPRPRKKPRALPTELFRRCRRHPVHAQQKTLGGHQRDG